MSAYENVLRGVAIITDPQKFTREGTAEGRAYYEKAIKLDPAYGRAYAELAYTFVRDVEFGWADDPDATLDKAEALARRAIELSGEYEGHWFLGQILSTRGRFDESLAEYETAMRLNPNDADLAASLSGALVYGGESARAIEMIEGAIKRNPEVPHWYWWNLAWAYYMVGRYEDALKAIDKISDPPGHVLALTAAAKAQLGDEKRAAADMEKFMKAEPDWTLENEAALHFRDDKDRQRWLDGLRKAGLREK
jgi:tetratricopeptide (TPR) repeat protein